MQNCTSVRAARSHTSTRIRVGAIAVLGLLLGGCFYSSAPKFELASVAPALDEGGRYVMYSERTEGDRYGRSEHVVVTHLRDGGYQFGNEKGESATFYFHAIPGGLHVVQTWEESLTRYDYVVVRVTPTEALVFIPQCDDQDKERLASLGVELRSGLRSLECPIDRVTDPAALFSTVKLGDPTSKLVRE
jgi:hypothetical protein